MNVTKKWSWQKVAPYLFVAPFILSFLVFSIYPLIQAIIMSFQQIHGFAHTEWIGFENYRRLLNDSRFYTALWNVGRYTFWTLMILIPLPMVLSFMMNSKLTVFKNFFRSVYFLPVLTSSIIAGLVFNFALSSEASGGFNQFLAIFGIERVRWLERAPTAMFALVIIAVWRWLGVNMIYFLSGLQGISRELYESAEVDGANSWKKFIYITVPMLKPITIFVITISVTGGFSLFNEAFVFWGVTSPNDIGLTIVALIYRAAFTLGEFGYAAAIGVALFLIIIIVNLIQLKILGVFKEE